MIVLSEIVIDNEQIDLRRIICERHLDEDNLEYFFNYMATPDMDVNARLQQHADELNDEIQYEEEHAKEFQQQEKEALETQIDNLQAQLAEVSDGAAALDMAAG